MTFEQLVTEAYNSTDLIKACRSIADNNWEDLRGKITLRMLEMPIEQRLKVKSVKGFMIRSCWNLGLDEKRKFANIKFVELKDFEENIEIVNTKVIDKIKSDLEHPKRFYHARVFVYSNVYGNVLGLYKKIKSTGLNIPYAELLNVYNEYKLYLKNYARQ